jgi:hypothetical protein
MKVISIGTKVVTEIGQVKAMVTGVCIRGEKGAIVTYEISYFQGGVYTSCWLHDFEFKIDTSTQAGFKRYDEEENILLLE